MNDDGVSRIDMSALRSLQLHGAGMGGAVAMLGMCAVGDHVVEGSAGWHLAMDLATEGVDVACHDPRCRRGLAPRFRRVPRRMTPIRRSSSTAGDS